jgi:hypothetical protein
MAVIAALGSGAVLTLGELHRMARAIKTFFYWEGSVPEYLKGQYTIYHPFKLKND